MHKLISFVILTALAATLTACGGREVAGNTQASPVAMTATSSPTPVTPTTTATPVPSATPTATATPVPPTPTSALILDNTGTYRFISKISRQDQELIETDGAVARNAMHLTLRINLPNFPPEMEMIRAGTTTYVRGPLPNMPSTTDTWYRLPDQGLNIPSPVAIDAFFQLLIQPDMNLAAILKLVDHEEFDGKQCSVFGFDDLFKQLVIRMLNANAGPAATTIVSDFETRFSVCEDGKIGRIISVFQATDASNPSPDNSMIISAGIYDIGDDITITVPSDATPLH